MTNINFVFNRAIKLIINPKAEWQVIQTETQTKKIIYRNYALPWIIIMMLCSVVGDLLNSQPIAFIITKAVIIFIIAFIVINLSTLIINELTASFNSKKDIDTTFKLVVYSLTGYFVMTAITSLIPLPPIQTLMVLSLYSIYLYWIGTTPLMDTPEDNKMGFVTVSGLVIVGIYAVLHLILYNIILYGLSSLSLII